MAIGCRVVHRAPLQDKAASRRPRIPMERTGTSYTNIDGEAPRSVSGSMQFVLSWDPRVEPRTRELMNIVSEQAVVRLAPCRAELVKDTARRWTLTQTDRCICNMSVNIQTYIESQPSRIATRRETYLVVMLPALCPP